MITNYEITEKTMAVVPFESSGNTSKVLESDKEHIFTFKEKPFAIIEQNCIKYFSFYAGRRKSVLHHTDYKMKTPIPISSTRGIIVFPTQGLSNMECAWIFYHHVSKVEKHGDGCKVIFKNGTELFQPVSKNRLEKQISRCHQLSFIIEKNGESEASPSVNLFEVLNRILSSLIQKDSVETQE